jgi:hypothetical protein
MGTKCLRDAAFTIPFLEESKTRGWRILKHVKNTPSQEYQNLPTRPAHNPSPSYIVLILLSPIQYRRRSAQLANVAGMRILIWFRINGPSPQGAINGIQQTSSDRHHGILLYQLLQK